MNDHDPRLKAISEEVVTSKGYVLEDARFIASKEFTFRWKLNGDRVTLLVSDYIDDAPDQVIRQFVSGACTYIFGGRHVFGDDYLSYMRSDEFILKKRPTYFSRCRRIARTDVGKYRNLFDSVQRLLDRGLLLNSDIDNTLFSWTKGENLTKLGYCAQMFRLVVISAVFDDPHVPEEILDYVVFHECLHLRQGYRPFNRHPHDAEFRRQESLYPDHQRLEKELKEILRNRRGRAGIGP